MIALLAVAIVIVVGALVFTGPPNYPYPENPDLGELDQKISRDFKIQIIECEDDYAGRVEATLMSKKVPDSLNQNKAVLYIHGYGDYFFQYHMAMKYLEAGYNFYALDLRKQGRSWLAHQRPCFTKDLSEYYEEIDEALKRITEAGNTFIVLNGHSQGGLLTSLYTAEGANKGLIDVLFLNSPFLDWPFDATTRSILIPIVKTLGDLQPGGALVLDSGPSPYGMSMHKDQKGEWDYCLDWKPNEGFPKYHMWTEAIVNAHQKVHDGLGLKLPVLVMVSDQSVTSPTYSEKWQQADGVLNVEDIKKWSPKLGENVTVQEIPNAMHDIFASKKEVRESAFKQLFDWLEAL